MKYVLVHMFKGDVAIHGPFADRDEASEYMSCHFSVTQTTFIRPLKRLFYP